MTKNLRFTFLPPIPLPAPPPSLPPSFFTFLEVGITKQSIDEPTLARIKLADHTHHKQVLDLQRRRVLHKDNTEIRNDS